MEAPKRKRVNDLSEQELAERSGTTVQQLRHLVEPGIISPTDRAYQPSDLQRMSACTLLGARQARAAAGAPGR